MFNCDCKNDMSLIELFRSAGFNVLSLGDCESADTAKRLMDSEIIRRDVDDILTASDAELIEGMRFFASRMKMIVEPTGCLGFAAARRMDLKGQRVGVIVSGGNVDLTRFSALLAG